MTEPVHVPVMLDRVLELLVPSIDRPGAVLVDATLGLAGHAEAALQRHSELQLVGIDRDPQALEHAAARLAPFRSRVALVHSGYDALAEVLDDRGLDRVDGVLFDLGVSSLQLDLDERGFAYSRDTHLDMRMDPTTGVTAAEIIATYDADRLATVFRWYGEERFAARIARAIVAERAVTPLTSTARLADIVRDAVPAATRRKGGHPAKRVFQALRIEVNAELDQLRVAMPAAMSTLAVGGRLVVLAYQSLEDRIVKRAIATGTQTDAPPDLPLRAAALTPELRSLTRGAEQAGEDEVAMNPRAASVRLRAAERLREAS